MQTSSDGPQEQHSCCEGPFFFPTRTIHREYFSIELGVPQVKQVEHIGHGQTKDNRPQQGHNARTRSYRMKLVVETNPKYGVIVTHILPPATRGITIRI
jgi:hypothetical protein